MSTWVRLSVISTFLLNITACSILGVRPWERNLLSESEMQFGTHPLEEGFDDHIYFSKEGSSVGRGFSAGGCGCN